MKDRGTLSKRKGRDNLPKRKEPGTLPKEVSGTLPKRKEPNLEELVTEKELTADRIPSPKNIGSLVRTYYIYLDEDEEYLVRKEAERIIEEFEARCESFDKESPEYCYMQIYHTIAFEQALSYKTAVDEGEGRKSRLDNRHKTEMHGIKSYYQETVEMFNNFLNFDQGTFYRVVPPIAAGVGLYYGLQSMDSAILGAAIAYFIDEGVLQLVARLGRRKITKETVVRQKKQQCAYNQEARKVLDANEHERREIYEHAETLAGSAYKKHIDPEYEIGVSLVDGLGELDEHRNRAKKDLDHEMQVEV